MSLSPPQSKWTFRKDSDVVGCPAHWLSVSFAASQLPRRTGTTLQRASAPLPTAVDSQACQKTKREFLLPAGRSFRDAEPFPLSRPCPTRPGSTLERGQHSLSDVVVWGEEQDLCVFQQSPGLSSSLRAFLFGSSSCQLGVIPPVCPSSSDKKIRGRRVKKARWPLARRASVPASAQALDRLAACRTPVWTRATPPAGCSQQWTCVPVWFRRILSAVLD